MGCDKALLPFRGAPLIRSVARTVEAAAGSARIVGNPERYGDIGYEVIADRYPGEGPLGGILTALGTAAAADWNLMVACDMPALTVEVLSGLFAAAEESDADILVPLGAGGRLEALCAVYHRRSREALSAAFDRGVRKVTAAFEGLLVSTVTADLTAFENVNTPEEWAGYAAK